MKKFEFEDSIYNDVANQLQIHDDCFDDRFIIELDDLTDRLPMVLTNIANRSTYPYGSRGTHKLIGANIFNRKGENEIDNRCPREIMGLYNHVINRILHDDEGNVGVNVGLEGISINVQPMGQNGTPHRDGVFNGNDKTLMYFVNNRWEKKWGGPFQILNPETNEVLKEVDFVPGRLVYFDGGLLHRGLAPKNVPYVYRKSIVFRIKMR
jgi:hypothetical protein